MAIAVLTPSNVPQASLDEEDPANSVGFTLVPITAPIPFDEATLNIRRGLFLDEFLAQPFSEEAKADDEETLMMTKVAS